MKEVFGGRGWTESQVGKSGMILKASERFCAGRYMVQGLGGVMSIVRTGRS